MAPSEARSTGTLQFFVLLMIHFIINYLLFRNFLSDLENSIFSVLDKVVPIFLLIAFWRGRKAAEVIVLKPNFHGRKNKIIKRFKIEITFFTSISMYAFFIFSYGLDAFWEDVNRYSTWFLLGTSLPIIFVNLMLSLLLSAGFFVETLYSSKRHM